MDTPNQNQTMKQAPVLALKLSFLLLAASLFAMPAHADDRSQLAKDLKKVIEILDSKGAKAASNAVPKLHSGVAGIELPFLFADTIGVDGRSEQLQYRPGSLSKEKIRELNNIFMDALRIAFDKEPRYDTSSMEGVGKSGKIRINIDYTDGMIVITK